MENPRWVPEILLAYALQSPSGTFTQDFNTNFLRTSNSGTASTELVKVSQNCGSRGLQDPNPPAEAPESSGSARVAELVRNENSTVNPPVNSSIFGRRPKMRTLQSIRQSN